MRRVSSLLLAIMLLSLGVGVAPAVRAASGPTDLAAMQRHPSDLTDEGLSYVGGQHLMLADLDASLRQPLEAARFRFGHELFLGQVNKRGRFVWSTIYAFAGPRSAAGGYERVVDWALETEQRVDGARTAGEASTVTTGTHQNDDGSVNHYVTIVVRQGQFVARIALGDLEGGKPTSAEATRLGAILAKRIRAAQAGTSPAPGLSRHVLRFTGPSQYMLTDAYLRLDGEEVGGPLTITAAETDYVKLFAGATDLYTTIQIANPNINASEPSVNWYLATFPDEQTASRWVENYIPLEEQGPAQKQVTSRSEKVQYGDETRLAIYHSDENGARTEGVMIVARYGTTGVVLTIEAHQPVSAAVARGLMTQADHDCLQASACAPVAVPTSLLALAE